MISLKEKNFILFSIVLCFIFISLITRLLPQGMFFDGITYAAISHNMSIDKGSIWQPYYSGSFYEHPPLMFFIQSFFYKILGDSYMVEKLYCFIVSSLTILIIINFWRLIFRDNKSCKDAYWLPLFVWYVMPSVYWAQVVNLLDNTLTLFTLLASYLMIRGLTNKKFVYSLTFVSAFLTFVAFLVKGPTSLSPLFIAIVYHFSFKDITLKKAIEITVIMVLALIFLFILLLAYSPARNFFSTYFNQQIINSLAGKREHTGSPLQHFQLIVDIITQLIPAFVIIGLLMVTNKRITLDYSKSLFRFFGILALLSSLPIMISIKQTAFYMMPSFPFYSIAASIVIAPLLVNNVNVWKINRKIHKTILVAVCLASSFGAFVSIKSINTIGRDENILEDFIIFDEKLKCVNQIYAPSKIATDVCLLAYLQRYYRIDFVQYPSDSIKLDGLRRCGINLKIQQPSDTLTILITKDLIENYKMDKRYKKIVGKNYALLIPNMFDNNLK